MLELFDDELVLELSVEELEDEDEDCELTTFGPLLPPPPPQETTKSVTAR